MPPITRAVRRQRAGTERWRCGACFFELPEYTRLEPFDSPYDDISDYKPPEYDESSGSLDVYANLYAASSQRGCRICNIIWRWIRKFDDWGILWEHGSIQGIKGLLDFQIFWLNSASPIRRPINHPFIEVGDFPSGDTSSLISFQRIAGWMQRCSQEHQHCTGSLEGASLPSRILYIEDFSSFHIRLIEDTKELTAHPYVCLSHRWMPATKACSLTKERGETFRKRIPEDLFYPLLRDAVEITHRLGFCYLWIDCLCIYQDDMQDWHSQVSEMSAIYENAAITISALSSGPLANQRLFANSKPRKVMKLNFGHTCPVFLRKPSHPFSIDCGDKSHWTNPSDEYPLTTRGWAFQERHLSRKVIHFTHYEVIWECMDALWCECRYMERAWADLKLHTPKFIALEWAKIIEEYTKTELSIDNDTLPAISGIAKRFGELRGWTYLAGLWREDLIKEFWWMTNRGSDCRRLRSKGLPSWSWASVAGEGSVFFREYDPGLVTIIAHDVDLSSNIFGIPKYASITLEASCITGTLLYGLDIDDNIEPQTKACLQQWDMMILEMEGFYLGGRPDYRFTETGIDHIASGSKVLFMRLHIDEYQIVMGLVLLCTDLSKGIYERIGVARSPDLMDHVSQDNLRRGWETKTLILI